MVDMDGLKAIHDRHGHLMGAHVISTVGRRLGALIQAQQGVYSRFGGDERSAFVPAIDCDATLEFGVRWPRRGRCIRTLGEQEWFGA